MTTYAEKRNLPYTPEQLFNLVADVERYSEFLPWCLKKQNNVQKMKKTAFFAQTWLLGIKMLRERFVSKVTLEKPGHVHVEYISGPMKYLSNHWRFIRNEDGSSTIDFFVEFEFKSKVLQHLMGVFFNEIVQKMVSAFEERARSLYGVSGLDQKIKRHRTG